MGRSSLSFVAVLGVIAALFVAAPAAAAATGSCTVNGGTVAVTTDAGFSQETQEFFYLLVAQDGDTLKFEILDAQTGETAQAISCSGGTPSVSTTQFLSITMTSASPTIALSFNGGHFAPSGGSTSMNITIDTSASNGNGVVQMGGEQGAANRIKAGSNGLSIDGADEVDMTLVGVGLLILVGGPLADNLSMGGGGALGAASSLQGILWGDAGNDTVRGGTNDDEVGGGDGADRLYGGAGSDQLGRLECCGLGDAGADQLYGEAGMDSLRGDDGNDLLVGGPDTDFFEGDAGSDTASYAASPSAVTVSQDGKANDGRTVSGVSEQDNVGWDVETVTGSAFADRLSGSSFASTPPPGTSTVNRLNGLGGNDVLNGLSGNDVLNGGPGTNTLNGGDGADTLLGGTARDVINGGAGTDTAKGGAGGDDIRGNDGGDVLYGQDGDDAINGGANTDTCYGGAGKNTLTSCEKP